ncbi:MULTISPECIES: ATP synthase subunit I [Cupriavidus]|uniref:Putative ATP synthase protein I n=1 Tax=Cupriavidus pinatubonensis (strain JMP 134 / LMG 1197) TaxID=264198 RepID=Q46VX3_CUPPJ|nr:MULTISPECIES: ATP synthase subunit I [Cupriavidus]QYY31533.1 ATP synthase subunit I [Cupriavidus pinatubonensis]TPQ39499.1 ATP synthase subunit I [Cupriavidus pinatubonensis]
MRQTVVVRDRQQQNDSRQVNARNDEWDFDAEREEEAVDPLSRAEAVTLFGERALRPSRMTPGKVVLAQVVVTLLSALCWALFGKQAGPYGWSALLGGAVCFVPSGFFAFRLWMARDRASIGGLVMGEAIKVFATVALMVLVVVLYRDLRWVPMLVTLLLALKTYWVVALVMR